MLVFVTKEGRFFLLNVFCVVKELMCSGMMMVFLPLYSVWETVIFFFKTKVGKLLLKKKKSQKVNILVFLATKNLCIFFSLLFPFLSTEIILLMGYTKIGPNSFLAQRLLFGLLTSVLMNHPCSSEEGQWMQQDPMSSQSGILVQAPWLFKCSLVHIRCYIAI